MFFAPLKGASLALQAYLGSLVILGLGLNCLQFIANSLLLGVSCNKIAFSYLYHNRFKNLFCYNFCLKFKFLRKIYALW
ncbi:hypothetical protein GHL12_07230 [Campylobacter jejuni]|uniref:Uncharacterized protein n=1 Tax=Campylobacter jejuni TaxID=197 RepID=A0A430Y4D9_CAMJU|nr:hypothetical protein [Campylobacter jejuni]PCH21771.1 hypothetical protein BGS41_00785 [Campylobacter sp. 108]EAI4881150.1 hypothetical protein [Campylobacter jejuni]EAL7805289.1 hypothetical protein [Campylobacter jejuni]ECL9116714.1 hypothetical protein [Campylobacter jejuni]